MGISICSVGTCMWYRYVVWESAFVVWVCGIGISLGGIGMWYRVSVPSLLTASSGKAGQ